MDVFKIEPFGAAAVLQKSAQAEDAPRPPLVPSEKNNAILAKRKPRTREIASRYKPVVSSTPASAPSTPKRCPSPTASRASSAPGTSLPKRAQSAERRRPTTPSSRLCAPFTPSGRPSTPSSLPSRSTTPARDVVTETHNNARRLPTSRTPDSLWPSMRSLSSSFQSEFISTPISKKEKVVSDSSDRMVKSSANVVPERKRSPLRGRNTPDQSENSRPLENSSMRATEHHRWPAMLGGRLSGNVLSRSVDLTDKINKSSSFSVVSRGVSQRRSMCISEGPVRSLQQLPSEVTRRLSIDGSGKVELDFKSAVNSSSQPLERSSSATRPSRAQSLGRAEQEMKSGVSSSSQPSERSSSATHPSRAHTLGRAEQVMKSGLKFSSQLSERPSFAMRPSRACSLPVSGSHRPSTPNKTLSTSSYTSRGMLSPSRTRPSTPVSLASSATIRATAVSSVLNYIADTRRGKKSVNCIEDAHQLRLLYNIGLQWRFANARADDTLMIQKMGTENILHSMWDSISKLQDSVILKRIDLHHLQREMKLDIILKEQMAYLEHWVTLEREHCSSLSGAVEALKASTLRLPVTGGAKADILAVKNAVSSAVDVMQAMGSSICYLISKVEGSKSLLSELSVVAAKEKAMLDECRELLASAAAMQVQESSFRTHLIQLRQDAFQLE